MKKSEIASNWRKTIEGLISKMYSAQKQRSDIKGYPLPLYTRKELLSLALNSRSFLLLYSEWVNSGYKLDLIPTFDRKNDYKGYSFENLNQWMTFKENSDKGHFDKRNGINKKQLKTVIRIDKITSNEVEYHSMAEAERITGIPNQNISLCCNGKRKSAGNYKWEFKKEGI